MNKLTELPCEEWPSLRELYKKDWPTHIVGYYTIDNYIKWFTKEPDIKNIKIYTLNGDYSDGVYIIVDRYMVLLNTLSSNHDRLIAALHLLDYSKKRLLNGYVSSLRTTVNKFVEENNLDLKRTLDSKTVFFHLPKEDAGKFEIEYPEGITFKSLGEEHAALVNEEWPFHHEGSLYFVRRLIKLNPSIGAFTKDNEPIAWCLRLQIGSLGLLQVRETHKRKGFGSIIVKVMSQVLEKMDCDIVAPVVEENFASRSLFEKLGFKIIDNLFWSIVENDTSTAWKDEDDL